VTRRATRGFVPEALVRARGSRGWSRAQLSIASGVTVSSLHRWESGAGAPAVDKLRAVLEALQPGASRALVPEFLGITPAERHPGDWRSLLLLTLEELAAQVGISGAQLSGVERGLSWPTNPEVVDRIAGALGISVEELRASYERARRDAIA
jgi:transcriptional regulator with XRE-family HTH domain